MQPHSPLRCASSGIRMCGRARIGTSSTTPQMGIGEAIWPLYRRHWLSTMHDILTGHLGGLFSAVSLARSRASSTAAIGRTTSTFVGPDAHWMQCDDASPVCHIAVWCVRGICRLEPRRHVEYVHSFRTQGTDTKAKQYP